RHGAEQVAREGRLQRRVAAGQPLFISLDSAVERLHHPLHLTADAEIAGAHLAQRPVEIGEHRIDKALAELRRRRRLALQAGEEEKHMKKAKMEPSGEVW